MRSESGIDPRYASITDERKRRRMISKRDSARRSRMRKQKKMEDLMNEVTVLKNDNSRNMESLDAVTRQFIEMESQNSILRDQTIELSDRLRSLNSVIEIVEQCSGLDLDIPEIPGPILNPWQSPYPVQPVQPMFDCPFSC